MWSAAAVKKRSIDCMWRGDLGGREEGYKGEGDKIGADSVAGGM